MLSLFFVEIDFQLNSHLTTLASIHKIHHTLHRLVNTYWQLVYFTYVRFVRECALCYMCVLLTSMWCFHASVLIEPDRRRWTG